MDRSDLEFRNALRLQITALEEKQALLSCAMQAILRRASDRTWKERGPGIPADSTPVAELRSGARLTPLEHSTLTGYGG